MRLASFYGWFTEGFDTLDLKRRRRCSMNYSDCTVWGRYELANLVHDDASRRPAIKLRVDKKSCDLKNIATMTRSRSPAWSARAKSAPVNCSTWRLLVRRPSI